MGGGRINLLSAGFNCQPYSQAGKQRAENDERDMWPETIRVVRELRPDWFIGENVAGFISLGLDRAISQLEEEGYKARTFVLPACAVGAPHERYRVFIIANSGNKPEPQENKKISTIGGGREARHNVGRRNRSPIPGVYWEVFKSPFPGVDAGVPVGLDRYRALGNPVVPQQIYPILKCIADIENGVIA